MLAELHPQSRQHPAQVIATGTYFIFQEKAPPPPPKEKNQPCILPPLLPKQRTRTLIVPPGTTSAAISCSSLSSEPDRMLAISKMMSDTCIERGAKYPSETRLLFPSPPVLFSSSKKRTCIHGRATHVDNAVKVDVARRDRSSRRRRWRRRRSQALLSSSKSGHTMSTRAHTLQ